MSEEFEVLISQEEIQKRVNELGKKIRSDYGDEEITYLCILKGSFIFCSDLLRATAGPTQVEFIQASSYGDATETSGKVDLNYFFTHSLKGKNVVIVEDIVDTGTTLKYLMEDLDQKEAPKSLKLASLLSKPSRRVHETHIDYLGFEIEDKFVIGYGLDLAQNYRHIPYIALYKS